MKLTQDELLKRLNEKDLKPIIQPKTNLLYVLMRVGIGHEVPIFFVILNDGALLQTLAYLPFELQKEAKSEIARLLHLVNRDIDLPGFGMDENQKLIFYRLVVPCIDNELPDKTLDLLLGSTKIAAETFIEAIRVVASGEMTIEKILKRKT